MAALDSTSSPTPTIEEYLKTIFLLQTDAEAKPTAIAAALGVAGPTVTVTLRRLEKAGLVERFGKRVRLTALGVNQALSVIRRNEVARTFLHEVLRLPEDQASEDACRLEHAMSPRVTEALIEFLASRSIPRGRHLLFRTFGSAAIAVLATVALLLAIVSPASAAPRTWADVAGETNDYLNRAVSVYAPASPEPAKKLVDKAYFGPFEKDGMEATIKTHLSASRAFKLEQEFKQLKVRMSAGAPVSEIKSRAEGLEKDLSSDAAALDGGGGSSKANASPFLQSFGILVREGFEAILILGAIVAYLRKSGNRRGVRTVQLGALAAIAASVVMAIALSSVFAGIGGFGQEVLEGATMLLAMAVLFWVSFWLAAKARARKWQEYIQDTVEKTATRGSTLALASVAFLAVFREGGETILFYAALVSGNPGSLGPIALGFAAATAVLVCLYVALRWGSLRIPFKPFFMVTSGLLFYLAFVFAGQGIRELQEAGVIGSTLVSAVPVIDTFGIYPTAESLLMQAALLAAAIGAAVWQWRSGRPGTPRKLQEAGGTS